MPSRGGEESWAARKDRAANEGHDGQEGMRKEEFGGHALIWKWARLGWGVGIEVGAWEGSGDISRDRRVRVWVDECLSVVCRVVEGFTHKRYKVEDVICITL